MKTFTASFFGHRQIDNVFVIEQRLQEIIQELPYIQRICRVPCWS